jgi:hypothetical protein
MSNLNLFTWWVISISGSIIFLMIVAIFLYIASRAALKKNNRITKNASSLVSDFTFLWFLLGLLVFYVISIRIGSAIVFALGNIFVEVLLVLYLLRNRWHSSNQ